MSLTNRKEYSIGCFFPSYSYLLKNPSLHRFHKLLGWQPVHRRLHRQQSRSFRRCPEFIFKKKLTLGSHPNPKHPPQTKLSNIPWFFRWTWINKFPTFPSRKLHSSLSCFASALSKGIFIIKNASAKPWTPKPTGRCRRLERRASTSKVKGIKDAPILKRKKRLKSKSCLFSSFHSISHEFLVGHIKSDNKSSMDPVLDWPICLNPRCHWIIISINDLSANLRTMWWGSNDKASQIWNKKCLSLCIYIYIYIYTRIPDPTPTFRPKVPYPQTQPLYDNSKDSRPPTCPALLRLWVTTFVTS